jgi:hypothetical protein
MKFKLITGIILIMGILMGGCTQTGSNEGAVAPVSNNTSIETIQNTSSDDGYQNTDTLIDAPLVDCSKDFALKTKTDDSIKKLNRTKLGYAVIKNKYSNISDIDQKVEAYNGLSASIHIMENTYFSIIEDSWHNGIFFGNCYNFTDVDLDATKSFIDSESEWISYQFKDLKPQAEAAGYTT